MARAIELNLQPGRPVHAFWSHRGDAPIPVRDNTPWRSNGSPGGPSYEAMVGEVISLDAGGGVKIKVLASTLPDQTPETIIDFPPEFNQFVGGHRERMNQLLSTEGLRFSRPIDPDTGRICAIEIYKHVGGRPKRIR